MAATNETKTKADLIARIQQQTTLTRKQAESAVDALVGFLRDDVFTAGHSLQLRNFGTFSRRVRAARDARNPRTGEPIRTGDSKTLAFHPGKTMKGAL